MAESAAASNILLLNALATLPKTLFGDSSTQTTEGGTSTKQTMLSKDAIDALMKGLMEDERSGLAKIASSQKIPGMYNSTSQQLMINDLLARSAAEVAKAGAPTVTTTAPSKVTKETSGVLGSTSSLIGIGALALGTKKGREMLGVDGLMADIAGPGTMLGGYSEAARAAASMPMGQSFASDVGYLGADWGAAAGAEEVGALAGGQVGALSVPSNDIGAMFGGDFSSVGEGGGFLGGESSGLAYLPAAMSLAEGNLNDATAQAGMAYFDPTGGWLTAADAITGGSISGAISDVFSSVGDIFDDACFITTACCKLYNKPDDCHELQTMRMFRDEFVAPNYPEAVNEYYAIAPGIVAAIEAREDANVIWADLYRHYIVPAVEFAQDKMYTQAYEIYTNMVNSAKEYAHG